MVSGALQNPLLVLYLVTCCQNSQNPSKVTKHPLSKPTKTVSVSPKKPKKKAHRVRCNFFSSIAHVIAAMLCVIFSRNFVIFSSFFSQFSLSPSYLVIFASSFGLYNSKLLIFKWIFSDSLLKYMQ